MPQIRLTRMPGPLACWGRHQGLTKLGKVKAILSALIVLKRRSQIPPLAAILIVRPVIQWKNKVSGHLSTRKTCVVRFSKQIVQAQTRHRSSRSG